MKPIMITVLTRIAIVIPIFGALILIAAGTWDVWEVYVLLGFSTVAMLIITFYFIKRNPEFLERRMKLKEKEGAQKKIIGFALPYYLLSIVFVGLDHRWGWSQLSWQYPVLGIILFLISYLMLFRVFLVNSYAARTVEVEEDQKVISTGPYATVRHPMYSAMILMYMSTPLALGSAWGIILFSMNSIMLVFRILSEEKVLSRDLKGYDEYMQKVKFRLIPYLW